MLIGITGTDGAGKGAVVDYLIKKAGFVHYSSRAFITAEIETQNLLVTREHMRLVANQMRKERGLGVIVTAALEKMHRDGSEKVIIESIRALAEVDVLKAAGGVLLAVDADQKIRFQRISGRQSASDKVTFAEFVKQEEIEMNDPDPNGMQKAAVIKRADYTIENSDSLNSLYAQIDTFLKKFNG